MRDRVLSAVEQLGYEPNLLWEALRLGETHTIGIVLRDVTSSLWSDIAFGAETVFQEGGYSMLLSNSRGRSAFDAAQIRLLDRRRVDGILVAPTDIHDKAVLAALSRLRIPVVALDRELPPKLGASRVLIDHRAGVGAATKALLALGHRRMGLVSPPAQLRPSQESAAAMTSLCAEHGASLRIVAGPFTIDQGLAAALELLTGERPVTAIVSGSNQLFPGVMLAIRELRLRIPRDVSLVAVDDLALLSALNPPVSFVTRHPRLVGETAAHLMLDRLRGGRAGSETVRSTFVGTESCAPPRAVSSRRRLRAPADAGCP